MRISEIGEFGLIDLVAKVTGTAQPQATALPGRPTLVTGIGDDTAAWQIGNTIELATTDTLVQNVHFSFQYATWRELGWKALAVNMSDIASMGGFTTFALVTLGLPKDTEVQAVLELYKGMQSVGNDEGLSIVGGDMVNSPQVFITVALSGLASKNSTGEPTLLLRSEAKVGDHIAVTGTLGASGAGLLMLMQELSFDLAIQSKLRQAHLMPIPRMHEGRTLVRAGVKSAMDISDGLLIDLEKVCQASKVGARVYEKDLPIDPAVKAAFPNDYLKLALSGGEDYEILFTARNDQIENIKKMVSTPITVIGEIVDDPRHQATIIDRHGRERALANAGWDHFTASPKV